MVFELLIDAKRTVASWPTKYKDICNILSSQLQRRFCYLSFRMQKVPHIGKVQTDFTLRLNSHRKDVYKVVAISASAILL